MPPKSKPEDIARGLLVDALISYVAIMRERGYEPAPLHEWAAECEEMMVRISRRLAPVEQPVDTVAALIGSTVDERVEALIEERRGLIRDTMQNDLDEIEEPPEETPCPVCDRTLRLTWIELSNGSRVLPFKCECGAVFMPELLQEKESDGANASPSTQDRQPLHNEVESDDMGQWF